MQVPFNSFLPMEQELKEPLQAAFQRILDHSWYILGAENASFEAAFSAFCGVEHCVGVGNGLDALMLILKALDIGPGDEVLVPSNTFIATALAVTHVGAKPVLVEPDPRKKLQKKSMPIPRQSCRCICTASPVTWIRSWQSQINMAFLWWKTVPRPTEPDTMGSG